MEGVIPGMRGPGSNFAGYSQTDLGSIHSFIHSFMLQPQPLNPPAPPPNPPPASPTLHFASRSWQQPFAVPTLPFALDLPAYFVISPSCGLLLPISFFWSLV